MNDSPLACIIIPAHNRCSHTLQCLEGLQWCAPLQEWRIVLVDDGSTDGTSAEVRAKHPHVEIVQGSGDLFWTGAIRLGMQRALDLGADVIIWLNDDTHSDEASLWRISRLVREQPDMVLASRALVNDEIFICNSLRRRAAPPTGQEFDEADVVAGYQVAFSSALPRKIGLPDDSRWPHYAGDSSYTHTAHKNGFRIRVDSLSHIHLSGHEPYLPVEEVFWRGSRTWSQRIQACFMAKKSKYRLSTQWHLDVLYRGLGGACMAFPARLALWILRIMRRRVTGPAR